MSNHLGNVYAAKETKNNISHVQYVFMKYLIFNSVGSKNSKCFVDSADFIDNLIQQHFDHKYFTWPVNRCYSNAFKKKTQNSLFYHSSRNANQLK